MKKLVLLSLATAGAFAVSGCASNADMGTTTSASMPMADTSASVTVGGAAMYPTRNIIENASNSPIHRTLVSAVKQAGLVETLSGPGPFTVFAPTDQAFAKVPSATLNSLMQPANKAALTKVLTYHVVPGRITAADLMAQIRAGGGRATLTTVEGEPLTATMMGDRVMISGLGGSMAHVTQADVMQSNGVIHVVDGVVLPTM